MGADERIIEWTGYFNSATDRSRKPVGRTLTAQQVPGLWSRSTRKVTGLDVGDEFEHVPGRPVPESVRVQMATGEGMRKVSLSEPDLYWCAPDMVDLAEDAAEALERLHWVTIPVPSTSGVMVLSRPLISTVLRGDLGAEEEQPVEIRAIQWHEDGLGFVRFFTYAETNPRALLPEVALLAEERWIREEDEGLSGWERRLDHRHDLVWRSPQEFVSPSLMT